MVVNKGFFMQSTKPQLESQQNLKPSTVQTEL
jgi:hypothetical protein